MNIFRDIADWLFGRRVWDESDLPFASPMERLVFSVFEQGADGGHVFTDIKGSYVNDRRPK